jgi:hypothetical protein
MGGSTAFDAQYPTGDLPIRRLEVHWKHWTLRPGDRMMDMNTTGKGHATEVISNEPAEDIIIPVD